MRHDLATALAATCLIAPAMGQSVEEEIAELHQIQTAYFSIAQEYTALLKLVVDKSAADQQVSAIEQSQLNQIATIRHHTPLWRVVAAPI